MSFEKIDNDELRAAIQRFSDFLRADYVKLDLHPISDSPSMANYHANQPDKWVPDAPGRDVVRIVHEAGSRRSAYCFIVLRDYSTRGKDWKRGDILMASGWKTPAFNSRRGNVIERDYGSATWAGPGYLR